MGTLFHRAINFMEEDFLEHKELFESLQHRQEPKVLFISCVDSRVVPNLITKSLPGDLFTIRNIANIVPPYRVSDEYLATTSAVEYALEILKIKTVIVCGHSNCGGCSALYIDPKKLENAPNVRRWIKMLEPIRDEILKIAPDDFARQSWLTERLNIINSLENLLTYPNVKKEYESGDIELYGWHYIIQTGEIFNYDLKTESFKLLSMEEE